VVEQSGVPDGFIMPVPISIEIGKNRGAVIRGIVDKPSNTLRINLPEKPKNVEFNILGSVLCHEK
jgi:hypothetical protein